MIDTYVKFTFVGAAEEDAVSGLLSDFLFTGFEETDQDLIGYIASPGYSKVTEKEIRDAVDGFVDRIIVEKIPFENWNQKWEEDYPEVTIGDFCRIYAPFHNQPTQKYEYEILISPQMAFGTGHHATTEMMIRLMSHMPDRIHNGVGLDFGTGTGILAILASRMGASSVDAVEIDDYAYQNLVENIQLNNATWITALPGGMDQVPDQPGYNFILANVTKNVLLTYNQDFFRRLKSGGRIIVSGILDVDKDEVVHAYLQTGFYGLQSMKIGKWSALMFGVRKQWVRG